MSVVFSSGTDELRRNSGLPQSTSFSMCGWFYLTSRTGSNSFSTLMCLISSFGIDRIAISIDSNSLDLDSNGGSTSFSSDPTTDEWFFAAMSCSGTGGSDLNGYWRNPEDASFVSASRSGESMTEAEMHFGNDNNPAEIRGRVACAKVWDHPLTENEFLIESHFVAPRTNLDNIYSWCPLWDDGDLSDYSANGNDWTEGGTLTAEDHPPVPWNHQSIVIPAVSTVTRTQFGYRWRDDDDDEASATWLANQDTNISRGKNVNTRLRIGTSTTGDAPSESVLWQYRRVGDPQWRDLLLESELP